MEENTESDATIDAEYLKWEADKIQQGYLEGYAKQGSNCKECQQIIVDKERRHYPHLCERCGDYFQKLGKMNTKEKQNQ